MDATNGGIHLLPHDVVLDILRRLPLHALAKSRRVCRAWRATVEDNTLLRTHFSCLFLPRVFPGIFTSNHRCAEESSFFAPAPSSLPRRDVDPDGDDEHGFRYPLFDHGWASVKDHCNGLLLLRENIGEECYYHVCNPATVRCARLPSPPVRLIGSFDQGVFLAFDPAVSRHHEVLLFPQTITQLRPRIQRPRMENLPLWRLFEEDQPFEEEEEELAQPQDQLHSEDPKDEIFSLLVFSSRKNEWKCREFSPEHCTTEHLYDIMPRCENHVQIWKSAQYWRGSLYVHCHKNILMILRISQGTYNMVHLPRIPLEEEERIGIEDLPTRSVLGSYEKGIHYVAFDRFHLQVWAPKEPVDEQLGWTLTHEAKLSPYVHRMNHSSLPTKSMVPWKAVKRKKAKLSLFKPLSYSEQLYLKYSYEGPPGPWTGRETREKAKKDPRYLWDSDEDNIINDMDERTTHLEPPSYGHCRIIGLHPHKDDVLLLSISGKALAYHLSTSRMQFLGKELVRNIQQGTQLHTCYGVKRAFPYRPCYVDALPTTKMSRWKEHIHLF